MSATAQKPWIEIRREVAPSTYRTYATAYRRPLRVWVLGRWVVGGAKVKP